jgi:hypothetical protein
MLLGYFPVNKMAINAKIVESTTPTKRNIRTMM